jgi:hypothetical protein
MYRFADQVFPEHGPKGGTPITPTRIPASARTFQLYIEPLTGSSDLFAQQNGASVAQDREAPELVAGIGLGDGLRSRRL